MGPWPDQEGRAKMEGREPARPEVPAGMLGEGEAERENVSLVHPPFPRGGQLSSKVGGVGVPLGWGAGVAVVGVPPHIPGQLKGCPHQQEPSTEGASVREWDCVSVLVICDC